MKNEQFIQIRNNWLLLLLITMTLAFAGCGGSSDSVINETAENGELVIGLTDAEGDFLSYSVDVLSLELTHENGAVIETMPLQTTIDFAQYTDLTEFLTAATVPKGVYVKGQMTVSYQNADIWVEDESGEAIQVAADNILDESGNPITQMVLSVHLEGQDSLRIAPGIPAHLTLDFDLNSSNRVDFTSGDPVITVQPVLLADVSLDKPKIHRVRGPLADVNLERSYYKVILRPFHHFMSLDRRFGSLNVLTAEETVYEIDGISYKGIEGLEALAAMPAFTATVAIGDLKHDPRRFVAREVYAGSSVAGGSLDVVRGNVIARSGDELTVRGATLIRDDGSVVFRDTITVTVSEDTLVKKQLSTGEHTIDEISVGQRVQVFGELSDDGEILAADKLRMLITRLFATRLSTNDETEAGLLLDLQTINNRPVELFDFSGTGEVEESDADPEHYEVDTGTLDLSLAASDVPVVVGGFVTPFGTAPLDFEAQTVVDLTAVHAVLTVDYQEGSAHAFKEISEAGLTLDLSDAGRFHHVVRGRVKTDLSELLVDTMLLPNPEGTGVFWIVNGEMRQLHSSFANFIADLEERINVDGALVKSVLANGSYFDDSSEMTIRRIIVRLL